MNHIDAAKTHTVKYPQYKRTEERSQPVIALKNIGKVGGPNWLKKGDISLGYFDEQGRGHIYSSLANGWCIVTAKPETKMRFQGRV